jgi:carboxyl-terminal processing protease
MAAKRQPWRRGLVVIAVLCPLALILPRPAPAASSLDDEQLNTLRAQAEQSEKLGNWGTAASKYEELLRLDRDQAFLRERYRYCLRRYLQVVRLQDSSYQKDVLTLKYPQAVRLYEIVVFNLLNNSLDRDKVSASALFHSGLDEYRIALSSPEFCSGHLGGLNPDQTRALRDLLQNQFGNLRTMTMEDAVEAMREAVMKSKNLFPNINPTTVVMEFLCGACLAVDDYTVYLTPRQLRELCATLKGQFVGIGLRLKKQDNKIVIADVLADSPAAETLPPLSRDDHILAIDKRSTANLTPETAMELLEGDERTVVQLVVASPGQRERIVALPRRAYFVPSVQHEVLGEIGYIKIQCMQESTVHEFDNRCTQLMEADCKALVLDLRGNPGGLLDVAIEIARRFLSTGVIVSTQHHDPRSSKVYRSDNPMALTLPVVVLVDSDTASAAEVLAGALKDNHRARVVGQTTYGKGCSQGLLKLTGDGELRLPPNSSSAGGIGAIRITTARFYSPLGQPYSGRGVEPDVPATGALQLYQAREEAHRLLNVPRSQQGF